MYLITRLFTFSPLFLCTFLVVHGAPTPNDKHASTQSTPHMHPHLPSVPASIDNQPVSVHSVYPEGHPEHGKHLMGVAKVSGNEHIHRMTGTNMQHLTQHIANEVSDRDNQVHDIHATHRKTYGVAHFSSTAHPHQAGQTHQTVLHDANPLSHQHQPSPIHDKISQSNNHATPHTERHIAPVVGVHGEGLIGTLNVHPDMRKPGGMTPEELRTHAEWVRHNVVGDRLGQGTTADVHVSHIHGTDKVHYQVVTNTGGTVAVNAAERQKIHDHVNNHLNDPRNLNPFTPANLHHIQLNHPVNGPINPPQQTYAHTLPIHPDHVNDASPPVMAAYADVIHQKLDHATGGQDPEMVVSTHHSSGQSDFHFQTQPRGNHEHHALPQSKKRATDVYTAIGEAYGHLSQPVLPHSEVDGAMHHAMRGGAEDSTDYNDALGHGYTIGVSGHRWKKPCPTCHEVLGTTTNASYQTMDKRLRNEDGRMIQPDDQYRERLRQQLYRG